jgi:hypothetical protein
MNAGVSTSPCAVRSTPVRASPSVAVTEKTLKRRLPGRVPI